MRPLVLTATATTLVVLLSGCFGNPMESVVEQIVEDQTGVDVSVGGEDGIANLPEDWPTEVPVPDGTVLMSFAADGMFSATIEFSDEAAATAGLDRFLSSGYATVSEANFGDLKTYTLKGNGYEVQYSFGPDADGVFVANLNAYPSS